MIRLKKGRIFFTPRAWRGVGGKPVDRKLISGHVCARCGIVMHAFFETDRPVEEELSQRWIECDTVAACEGVRDLHHVSPMYASYTLNGAQVLFEQYHWSIGEHNAEERCDSQSAILSPKDDSVQYVRRLIRWARSHGFITEYEWDNVIRPKWKDYGAHKILEYCLAHQYTYESPDVIPGGPRVIQLHNQYWSGSTFGYLAGIANL